MANPGSLLIARARGGSAAIPTETVDERFSLASQNRDIRTDSDEGSAGRNIPIRVRAHECIHTNWLASSLRRCDDVEYVRDDVGVVLLTQ